MVPRPATSGRWVLILIRVGSVLPKGIAMYMMGRESQEGLDEADERGAFVCTVKYCTLMPAGRISLQ